MTAFPDLLTRGGPVIWAIAALSVLTLALILWKLYRLSALGAW
jgi:biopolymer transport protein ExbB